MQLGVHVWFPLHSSVPVLSHHVLLANALELPLFLSGPSLDKYEPNIKQVSSPSV